MSCYVMFPGNAIGTVPPSTSSHPLQSTVYSASMSPHRGFWGSRTSAVDWCEANYTKTPYVAEFWNTLSSLALCVVAMIGLRFAHRYRYPLRIVIAYVGVFLIGTGSVAFHGTLTRTGQAIDELSMCWTVSVILYMLLSEDDLARFPRIGLGLFVFDCALTAVYCFAPFFFPFFLVMFAGIMISLQYRTYTIARFLCVEFQLSPYHVKWLRFLGIVSHGVYMTGLVCLWLLEVTLYCVPDGRLQLHAIYHVTCAVGVYNLIVFATLYNYLLRRDGDAGKALNASTPQHRNSVLLEVQVHKTVIPALYAVVIRPNKH